MSNNKYLFLSIVLGCCQFLSGCIEATDENPEGQIVVIGNGVEGSIVWNKTIVADIAKENSVISSLILSDKSIVPIADKARSQNADPQSEKVSWILPAPSGEEALIHFSSADIQSESQLVSMNTRCTVLKANSNGLQCDETLGSEDFSDEDRPVKLLTGDILFKTRSKSVVKISTTGVKEFLLENVGDFFTVGHYLIYQQQPEVAWKVYDLETRSSWTLLPTDGIIFRGLQGKVHLIVAGGTPVQSGTEILRTQVLYSYDLESRVLKKQWVLPDSRLSSISLTLLGQLGDSAIVKAISKAGVPKLLAVNSKGVVEIPFDFRLGDFDAILGRKNLLLTFRDISNPRLIGSFCSRHETEALGSKTERFDCTTILAPEKSKVVRATLADDTILVGLEALEIDTLDLKKIYALNSDKSSQDFGHAKKSWTVSGEIKDIRYFDADESLELIANIDSPAQNGQPDLSPGK